MLTAIVAAAGSGRRMGAGVNKVLLPLAGEPVLLRTLRALSRCAEVDALVVVVAADDREEVRALLAADSTLKPRQLVLGGRERQDSVRHALAALDPACDLVLVHDGARPLVGAGTVTAVVEAAREHGAALAAVPLKDTVKRVNAEGIVMATPDRRTLWAAQTPQAFRRGLLVGAYERATRDGFVGTDDASLVERLGLAVRVVPGDYRNLKLTTPDDLAAAEALLRQSAAGY